MEREVTVMQTIDKDVSKRYVNDRIRLYVRL